MSHSDAPVLEGSPPLPARGRVALLGRCTQGAGLCREPGLCLGAARWLQCRWWCRRRAQQWGPLSASVWRVKDEQWQPACHRNSFLPPPLCCPWFALSRTWRGGKTAQSVPRATLRRWGLGKWQHPDLFPMIPKLTAARLTPTMVRMGDPGESTAIPVPHGHNFTCSLTSHGAVLTPRGQNPSWRVPQTCKEGPSSNQGLWVLLSKTPTQETPAGSCPQSLKAAALRVLSLKELFHC